MRMEIKDKIQTQNIKKYRNCRRREEITEIQQIRFRGGGVFS